VLSIKDDGVGIEDGRSSSGHGLLGMRERVKLLGGRMRLDSRPARGTRIAVRIPLPAEGGP
jgi:signal transduction histidine kinase